MIQSSVFLLLFLLPFLIAPFGINSFEPPKVIIAEGLTIILFLFSLFTNTISLPKNKPVLLIYLLIIVLTISHLIFFSSPIAFFGNAFRLQGIFLLWILMLFSYLTADCAFENIPHWVFVAILLAETMLIFFLPINESRRYVGTMGEPNALATFAIFLWPFGFAALDKIKESKLVWKGLLIVPVCLILFFSGSRSGMIAFGIQLLFLILLGTKFSFKKAAIICLSVILFSYLFPLLQNNPYENRVEVWKSAITAGKANPILGSGFGNAEFVLHKAARKEGLPIQYYYFDSAHNLFLDWWVQGGIIGLVLFSALVLFTARMLLRSQNKREFLLFIGLIVSLSFNPASVCGLLGLWWLIGRGFGKGNGYK